MKTFVVLATVLAAACAAPQVTVNKVGYGPSHFVRAPAHDSASIEHHRLGGNFAYSTAEAHAFAEVKPEISVATHPVAETTYVHRPAAIKTIQPAPIVKTTHAARPIIGSEPVYGTEPVVGPVRQHTTYTQQVVKKQHVAVHQPHAVVHSQPHAVVQTQQVAAVATAPAVAVAPVAVEGYAAHAGLGYAHAGLPIAAGYGLNAGAYGINAAGYGINAAGYALPAGLAAEKVVVA